MDKIKFSELLSKQNIILNQTQSIQFDKYFAFLVQENAKYNLTTITDEEGVYEKHFYDSLSILFNHSLDGSVLDVGSGGGFPSVPLKIINPNMDLTILDSTNKKINFINSLANELNLNIKTVCARAEEHKQNFDYVIARGVAPLNILLELCCDLVKPNGYLIAMKGSRYLEEIEEAKNAIKTLGYELVSIQEYVLPTENSKHYNILLKKTKNHSNKYPRNYSKIKTASL